MAGKVKKGFGIYLFILLLMLIASALIVLLVMIFSPFKKIMGYQYVYYEDEYVDYNVTGGSSESIFDLSSLEEIKVNCNYAKVSLVRSDNTDKNMVKITNSVKGFATAEANVDFSYKLYYEAGSNNKTLCIQVHEPEAMLYFSQKVEISIVLPDDSSINLSNVNFNVANTSGNVFVGYHYKTDNLIDLAGLNIKSTSGSVYLGKNLGSQMKDIFIKSEYGDVLSLVNLNASQSFALNAKRGNLSFQDISVGSANASMNLGNCEFSAKRIVGGVELQMTDGYFDVDSLVGDISGNNPAEQLTTSTITIGEVVGNVSFPFANASKINIGKFSGGKLYVNGTSGFVKIGDLNGYAWIELTSGSVNVKANCEFEAKTISGKINVAYLSNTITDKLNLVSERGNVKLSVNSVLDFTLNVYDANGNMRTSNNVSVEGFDDVFEIPLDINKGGNPVNITTNSKVEVYLNEVA